MLQGYCQYKGLPFSEVECLLDLVVVSIASDIVPLVGENRILAHYGLKRLNEKPGKGLLSIIKICGLDKHQIYDRRHRIQDRASHQRRRAHGGRLRRRERRPVRRAFGRLSDGRARRGGSLRTRAFIDTCNQDRKNIDRSITQQAHELIERDAGDEGPQEHRDLQSEMDERHRRDRRVAPGSRPVPSNRRADDEQRLFSDRMARSVPGSISIKPSSGPDLLENLGRSHLCGRAHDAAGGVDEFCAHAPQRIRRTAHRSPDADSAGRGSNSELLFSDITPQFRSTLNRFQPFGPGNNSPVFVTRGVSNRGDARLVGTEREHLKMDLIQGQKPNTLIPAIAFQQPSC